jgi:hypothetical protein
MKKRDNKLFIIFVVLLVLLVLFSYFNKSKFTESKKYNDLNEVIDHIYYINLENRTDRKEQILSEINKVGLLSKTSRINAVYEKGRGHLGCTKSHILALEEFIKSGRNNCIIFEDDFKFIDDISTVKNTILKLFNQNVKYDVCMLAIGESVTIAYDINDPDHFLPYDFIKKSLCTFTGAGYLITKEFAPKLLRNFKESVVLLKKEYDKYSHMNINELNDSLTYQLDQHWCRLQPVSNWYVFNPVLGYQRGSQSDIDTRKIVNN